MENHCQHLTMTQRNELLKLLHKFEELFNGIFGTCKTYLIKLELKEYAKQICSRPYPVLKVHEEMFKNEVESLVLLGVLEVHNDSEWRGPSFGQPKPISNKVSSLNDFRKLKKRLNQKPYLCQKSMRCY